MKKWQDCKNKIDEANITEGYALIMLTDRVLLSQYPLDKQEENVMEQEFYGKMLDMRVFNSECEFHIFRGDSKAQFRYRILDSNNGMECYEDIQYLDETAMKQFKDKDYLKNKKYLEIVNYIDYDDCGCAFIRDWRIAGLM